MRCGGGVAGVEAASSRRRGHHAYDDAQGASDVISATAVPSRRRGHHAYDDAQGASDVISATAVPVDTIIVITYRG